MSTYRAAYFSNIVLTSEDQAGLSDAELRTEALAEAKRAGLIGSDAEANQVSEEEFADGLLVGNWTE